jgi:very-short-patch-repair endonuclease
MKKIDSPFYYDASIEMLSRASALRKNMTEAEKMLWSKLNKRQVNGLRFRRQHPIGKFIVDFYCHEKLLVIELEGAIHQKEEVKEHDEGREYELKKKGLNVLRFTNAEVMSDATKVIDSIAKFTQKQE